VSWSAFAEKIEGKWSGLIGEGIVVVIVGVRETSSGCRGVRWEFILKETHVWSAEGTSGNAMKEAIMS